MATETATGAAHGTHDAARAGTGNRLVLAGAALYFCEWVAIIAAGGIPVLLEPGTSPAKVLDAYAGHGDAYAWAAGWFSVVLLGRALFAVGVRHGLRNAGHDDPAAEFGVLAMLAGVVFEITAYALVMAGALLADHGATAETVTTIDTEGYSIDLMLWGGTGASALALGWAMYRSGLFPRILCGLAMVGGALLLVQGLAFTAPTFSDVQGALQVGALLMWIWMIWTGVLMWRRTPARAR